MFLLTVDASFLCDVFISLVKLSVLKRIKSFAFSKSHVTFRLSLIGWTRAG